MNNHGEIHNQWAALALNGFLLFRTVPIILAALGDCTHHLCAYQLKYHSYINKDVEHCIQEE